MATTTSATDVRLSIAHQTRFALRLASAIFSNPEYAATNAAYSPLSLHVGLSLVAAGAGGATREQLVAVLGSGEGGEDAEALHALAEQVVQLVLADASEAGGPRVAFADGVFVDASLPLKPSFRELAVGRYRADVQSVDFQAKPDEAVAQVHSWVEKVTTGLIQDVLPQGSVDNNTALVLANALYFKGAWHQSFDPSKTKDDMFHLLDGSSVQTPFMSTKNKQYISSPGNFKILKLPYHQGGDKRKFSMYILLPEARDGLWSLAKRLNTEPEFIENFIPTTKVAVGQFKLPKFKISFGFEASDLLKGLGLQLPFSPRADLSEMVDSSVAQNLYISSVHHKSFVVVNEEGTEATAATTVGAVTYSMPLTVDFVADHPFIFLIREDVSGVVLFVGHVVNPILSS
uniref:Uncharacterized protein n=1 Tax=Avena sativa TaxID=4498 RepID=A0ACD5X9J4_AVESA